MKHARASIHRRPPLFKTGDTVCAIEQNLVDRKDEKAIGLQFICQRRLFGHCYRQLHPNVFDWMGKGSGVFISPFVLSKEVVPHINFPGDIDLLVIPYEGDDLLLSRTLAIELKIVRASFEKQGKSPNEFGFSQASALLKNGFPFVAVGHLVVSNESPREAWRTVLTTVVLDDSGRVAEPTEAIHDMLPSDLLERSIGRMLSNCKNDRIGMFA